MVDDIRPREPKLPEDKNKNVSEFTPDNNQPAESLQPARNEFSGISAEPNNNEEEGFVVLPDGKSLKNNPFKKLAGKFNRLSKKNKILLLTGVCILLIGAGGGVYALTQNDPPPPPHQSLRRWKNHLSQLRKPLV